MLNDSTDTLRLDTGIYTAHHEFGGRASWGITVAPGEDEDNNGHGTLVASIAVGAHYGVATAANVIAVKVLSDQGKGAMADLIYGIEYSVWNALKSERPSVINISIDASPDDDLWEATVAGIEADVHFTAMAGDQYVNAGNRAFGRGVLFCSEKVIFKD
jgi:cerevisin